MAWVAGQKLHGGYYTVEKELGRGRFGITYLVRKDDGERRERRVVKTLNNDLLQSLSSEECSRLETLFWQEAVKLSKCRHPNIVEAGEPFKEGQQLCLAMEYVDGISLADRNLPLTESEALKYVQQIGEALEVVHQNRLVHRDVKPENIVVRGNNEAVLIDFGLAFDFYGSLRTIRTRERAEGYAPLELYSQQSHQVGAHTDVYSLAATLYVLLTGTVPPSAIKRKVDKVRLVPPREINNLVSDRTSRMILKGMELEVKNRPQTVREWLDSIGLIQEPSGVVTPSQPVDNFERKVKIRTSLLIAAIGAFGALLSGLAAMLTLFKPSSPPANPTTSPAPVSSPTSTKTP